MTASCVLAQVVTTTAKHAQYPHCRATGWWLPVGVGSRMDMGLGFRDLKRWWEVDTPGADFTRDTFPTLLRLLSVCGD